MDNEGKSPYVACPCFFFVFFNKQFPVFTVFFDIHQDSYIVIMFAGCLAMLL